MSKIENYEKSAELITNSMQSKFVTTTPTTEEDISDYLGELSEKNYTQTERTDSAQKPTVFKIDNEKFFSLREEHLREQCESTPDDIAKLDEYGIVTSILSAISSTPDLALSYAIKSLQTYKKIIQTTHTTDYYIRLTNSACMLADLEDSTDRKIETLNETLEILDNALKLETTDDELIIATVELCYNIGVLTSDNALSQQYLRRALKMADKTFKSPHNNIKAHYLAGLAAREIFTTRKTHDENAMMQKCRNHFKIVTKSNPQDIVSSKLMQASAYSLLSQLNPTEENYTIYNALQTYTGKFLQKMHILTF